MAPFVQVLVPVAMMILLIVAGVIAFSWIRRRYIDDPGAHPATGLTLHQLRTLRADGMLNDEEFEAARRAVLEQAGAADATTTEQPSNVQNTPPTNP